jgi:hypothetical protein
VRAAELAEVRPAIEVLVVGAVEDAVTGGSFATV